MKVQPSILRGVLVLPLLLVITACNEEAFKVGDGRAPGQKLTIGVYVDPLNPANCEVTYPKVNVRQVDTVKWKSLDRNKFIIYFPPTAAGTPFDKDTYADGQRTITPKVPAGKTYPYEIQLAGATGSKGKKCKDANDPYDDPGLSIRN